MLKLPTLLDDVVSGLLQPVAQWSRFHCCCRQDLFCCFALHLHIAEERVARNNHEYIPSAQLPNFELHRYPYDTRNPQTTQTTTTNQNCGHGIKYLP